MSEPRVIKKYPNRRLYDTVESRYITLADVRKLVVEPFLQLMVGRETETSRKRLFDALIDWIGIEKKFRPSSASINSIARELDARASASESNARRRTKN